MKDKVVSSDWGLKRLSINAPAWLALVLPALPHFLTFSLHQVPDPTRYPFVFCFHIVWHHLALVCLDTQARSRNMENMLKSSGIRPPEAGLMEIKEHIVKTAP